MTASLADAIEFIRLEETLRDFAKGEKFIFVANPGNWGDGLIRYATDRFLVQRGLSYVPMTFRAVQKANRDALLRKASASEVRMVYGGGGLFIEKYGRTKRIPELVQKSDRMLVLPHTFGMPAEKLGFRKGDILFRRDHAGSRDFAPDALFCHDMALSLGRISPYSKGVGTGYFFRQDAEKIPDMRLPEGNRDISAEGKEMTNIAGFLEAIAEFETVHTNRLHVAISGAMMGRRVHLYANSYFKNQSIFAASLERTFPNVSFHERFGDMADPS